MSSSPNLLLTGANGFVGFKVLLNALEQGYTVRAAIRSLSKADTITSHPKVKALGRSDALTFVEVPDITNQEAYFEAIKGITHVIHLASPLPSPVLDPETGIYLPNIKSTTSILHAAIKEPSVKKIVIASSIWANISLPPSSEKITAETRLAPNPKPYENMISAYSAGKAASLTAIADFIKEKSPTFDVVSVYPGFVFGTDDRALQAKDINASTNEMLLAVVKGEERTFAMPSGAVHVYDAAKLFMLALGEGVPKNIGATTPHTFDDAWEVVNKHFPKAVEAGTFTKGTQATFSVDWDATQTESHFGFKFRTYEDMVVDVAGQYLELLGKERS
ncbi:putative cinnamoyl-CoA reductase [Astrocystis sublimbata]|nr:putative cinnamoyl-CoA reductase [Astrocystis sublimbata]